MAARVGAAVDRICADNPVSDLILVAHIGVIMTQIQRASGGSAYAAMGHMIDNLSITDMSVTDAQWHIGTINHIP